MNTLFPVLWVAKLGTIWFVVVSFTNVIFIRIPLPSLGSISRTEKYNCKIKDIVISKNNLLTSINLELPNKRNIKCDYLISTIPFDDLVDYANIDMTDKNLMKTKDKSIWSKLSKKDAEKYILGPIKEIKKAKNKSIKKEFKRPIRIATGTTIAGSTDTKIDADHLLGWKKGGKIKTYAKGGGVRKPKMIAGY